MHRPSASRALLAACLAALAALPAAPALTAEEPPLSSVVWGVPPAPGAAGSQPGLAADLFAGEARVTTRPEWQNEAAITVDPANPNNLLAGANDYNYGQPNGFVWVGAYTSHDGGATWIEQPLPGTQPGNVLTGILPFPSAGDPILAWNGLGHAFAGGINFQGGQSYIFVSASLDQGDTWLQPTLASGAQSPLGFMDKPDMAADPASSWVYVCWTHFLPGFVTEFIAVTASPTGIGAWTPGIPVSEVGPVQGCTLAIGADGAINLAYLRFQGGLAGGGSMKFVRSTTNGAVWSQPVTITTLSPLSGANFRTPNFGSLAVDRSGGADDGDLYFVWADNRAGNADVWLSKSTDDGATWGVAVRVNQAAATGQFMPSVAVNKDGKVAVHWQDQRLGGYTAFGATSTDGGATWTEFQVASATAPASSTGGFYGDYQDIAAGSDGVFHAAWTDGRSGDQDIWTRAFS